MEQLIQDIGSTVGKRIDMVGETRLKDRVGRPDYGIAIEKLLCGYVELKAPGKGANPTLYTGHDSNQWKRFQSLPNLIYSDGIEWALYRGGKQTRFLRLSNSPLESGARAVNADDLHKVTVLITDFLNWAPIPPTTAQQLADYLAPLCRLLKDDVLEALRRRSPAIQTVARDWRRYLFPDADDETFADSYAQTVTFALLLARSVGSDALVIDKAVQALTSRNTLLGRALSVLTDEDVRADVGASLDMLVRVIHEVPSTTMSSGRRDPWLLFYEDFLQEYDPQLRRDAGAYYTPLPVVHAQTAIVDDLLRTRFDKPMGFAEGGVTTLDPAVGTGTYLLNILEHAMERVAKEEGKGAVKARASLLAQSLFGFEIMVGPYSVASLRMTRMIQDLGGKTPGDGVQIFLTNTLESPHEPIPELPLMYQAIGLEHKRAKRVKETVPVLVCIGNPPYDRHAAATELNKMSTGAWVRWGEDKDGRDAILNDFIDPVKKAGKGVQIKNLYNLYVYFWRWGLWKVFEQPYSEGGIVCFITASSFVDGDAFLGMREKMRHLCDELWVIDLGGDNRGTQRDENVFAVVQTPVAITVAVRYGAAKPDKAAKVHYTRIPGERSEKLAILGAITSIKDLKFKDAPAGWAAPFRPAFEATYFEWPKLIDLMPWQHSGAQFKRSWPIATEREILVNRWNFLKRSTNKAELFKETRDRKVHSQLSDLFTNAPLTPIAKLLDPDTVEIRRYAYRSFDYQYAMVDSRLGDFLRPALWATQSRRQLFFATALTQTITCGPALTVSSETPDLHFFNGRGAKDIIPLYRDSSCEHPNLHPQLLGYLSSLYSTEVSADNFACYAHAILSSPAYPIRFADELGNRDIRIPLTRSRGLFEQGVEIGRQLIFCQTYGERLTGDRTEGMARCLTPVSEAEVKNYWYMAETGTLHVGDGTFGPMDPAVWEYNVSGFPVLDSWLGYRMTSRSGRKSSDLDAIASEKWTSTATTDLLRVIWVLERTLSFAPRQAELLDAVLRQELVLAGDGGLNLVPDAFRKPEVSNSAQASLGFDG